MVEIKIYYERLFEEINRIRGIGTNLNKIDILVDSFDIYLKDLFEHYSCDITENTKNKHTYLGLTKINFLKFICNIPVFMAEKIFNSLDEKKLGFLSFEEFGEFLTCLRFGNPKAILELLFNCFDFDFRKKIHVEDIKFLLNHISNNYIIKILDENGGLQTEKVLCASDISEQLSTIFQNRTKEVKFKEFYDKLVNGKHDVVLYFYNYFYENIGSLRKNLSFYEFMNNNQKKNYSSKSSGHESTIIGSKLTTKKLFYNSDNLINISSISSLKSKDQFRQISVVSNRRSQTTHEIIQVSKNVPMFEKLGINHENSPVVTNKHKFQQGKTYLNKYNDELCMRFSSKDYGTLNKLKTNNNFNNLYTDDNINNFYKEDNNYLTNLEKELKSQISYEGNVYVGDELFSTLNHTMQTESLSENYLVLIEDMLYMYDNTNFGQYTKAFFLKGGNIRELHEVKINSVSYFPLAIFFLNDTQQTFYSKTRKKSSALLKVIRAAMTYKNFFTDNELIKELGAGTFGIVYKTFNTISGNKHATKILKKNFIRQDYWKRIKTEIEIIKTVNHPNIIKFVDTFENSEYYFMVLEYLKDGNLTKFIKSKLYLSENTVKTIIFQLANSLKYLKRLGIIHRDIKPDNILVDKTNDELKIKLTDFGFAKVLFNKETTNECLGSIPFSAPELLRKSDYGHGVDIWSLGVLIYYLLTYSFPFNVNLDKSMLIKSICIDTFSFTKLANRSIEATDLIKKCLNRDVDRRINIDDMIKHPWFDQGVN